MKYAFLILEPKRNDATKMVRHVLCSQSEEDRDEWINALLYYVTLEPEPPPPTQDKSRGRRFQRRPVRESASPIEPNTPLSQLSTSDNIQNEPETIGIRYDQTTIGKRPTTSSSDTNRHSIRSEASQDDVSRGIDNRAPRSSDSRSEFRQQAPAVPLRSPYRAPISPPMNGVPMTDDATWNGAQRDEERRREEKRSKKRSVWGFLSKGCKAAPAFLINRLPRSFDTRKYPTHCSSSSCLTAAWSVWDSITRCCWHHPRDGNGNKYPFCSVSLH
jgi:RalA-binding protein 1